MNWEKWVLLVGLLLTLMGAVTSTGSAVYVRLQDVLLDIVVIAAAAVLVVYA